MIRGIRHRGDRAHPRWPHRTVPRSTTAVTLALAGALSTACAASSPAAPPAAPVSGTVLAQARTNDPFTLDRREPSEFVVRRIVIEPGGSTGWHYHPGTLLAIVQRGSLTRIDADCRQVVHQAGQSLVEPSGPDHVHVGINRGTETVELYVTYVDPVGAALAVEAPDPHCGTG